MSAAGVVRPRSRGVHRRQGVATLHAAAPARQHRCASCGAYQSGSYHGGIAEMTLKQRKRLEEAFDSAGSKKKLQARTPATQLARMSNTRRQTKQRLRPRAACCVSVCHQTLGIMIVWQQLTLRRSSIIEAVTNPRRKLYMVIAWFVRPALCRTAHCANCSNPACVDAQSMQSRCR